MKVMPPLSALELLAQMARDPICVPAALEVRQGGFWKQHSKTLPPLASQTCASEMAGIALWRSIRGQVASKGVIKMSFLLTFLGPSDCSLTILCRESSIGTAARYGLANDRIGT